MVKALYKFLIYIVYYYYYILHFVVFRLGLMSICATENLWPGLTRSCIKQVHKFLISIIIFLDVTASIALGIVPDSRRTC